MRTGLVLLLVLSQPAAAGVTADVLWAEMQRLAGEVGTPLDAEVRRAGSDLILDRPMIDLGTAGDPLALRMERLVLRENPDGSVTVVVPDRFSLVLDLPPSPVATDPDKLTFTAAAPGLDIRVDDIGARATFRIEAPSVSLSLDPSAFTGGDRASLTLALADLRLDHRQDLGATVSTVNTALALGTLHADGLIAVADEEEATFALDLSAIVGSLFLDVDPSRLQDPQALVRDTLSDLADGQGARAALEHGPITFAMTLTDDEPGPTDLRVESASGRGALRFDRTGIEGNVTQGKTSIFALIEDPDVPFSQLDMGHEEAAFGVSLGIPGPVAPEPFAAFARLTGLTLSDPVWDQMDPGRAFPRDPISAALTLSGLLDEKPRSAPVASDGAVPVDLLSISLDELRLSGLGVDLSGRGALAFDNSDLVTFDGLAAPTGTLAFTATGVNALLDRVVAAGLFPAEDLTGLRFGLAFIAKPDTQPDSLTTQIEFRDKGLYLNGVKMR